MCVEIFAASTPQIVSKFAQVIEHLTSLTVDKTQQDIGAHSEVVSAYIGLCKRMVLEAPEAILKPSQSQGNATLLKCLNFSAKALASGQLFSSSHGTLLFWNTLLTLFQKAQHGNVLSSEVRAIPPVCYDVCFLSFSKFISAGHFLGGGGPAILKIWTIS